MKLHEANVGGTMNEKQKLAKAVDEFAKAMKARLFKKVDEGYTGWDETEFPVYDLVERMKIKTSSINGLLLGTPTKELIDIANFVMMLHRRIINPERLEEKC